ncbi:TonB-dependent receptor [Novosphingobium lentum]|uniref:TonB-dependent receptor n=1 Tax=Novosphingobium lentum TaxID=145287 RepID=UPI00082D8222|nr:TonB-dependent receptor [Novosphingobium lentum]
MNQRHKRIASAATIALAAALAFPATAQVVSAAHAPATADTPESTGIADIVVTAQKRSQSVQDVPVTVTAIGGEALASKGVKDLFQAVTLVPGVVFSRAPDDGLALTFRGLGTQARPQAFEQSVALFTDGVFMGKGRLYSTSFFDVDRMEFIKGTQSTLLGKNASLGAISIVTRQPGDTASFEGRAGYEFENGGYTVDAAADAPLSDQASLRIAGHYNDLKGWVRNDVTGHNGPEQRDLGLRATLKLKPTDNLTVTGSYQYASNKQIGASYQLVGNIPAIYGDGLLDGHTSQFTSLTQSGESEHLTRSHIANLKADLDLGSVQLVSQTSYVAYKLGFTDDFDFSPDDSINFLRKEKYHQFTQELRLQSPTGGRFEYMIGGFFLTSHWNSQESQLWAVPGFPPAGGPPPGQLFNGPFFNSFVQDQKAYSAFASGTLHLGDRLRVTGGLRYTREEKDIVYGRTNAAPFTVWNTIANPSFDPTPLHHNSNFLDGNASLQYDLTRDVMAYASVGHGSKAGGYVETNTIAVPPPLLVNGKVPAALVDAGSFIADEKVWSYEAGFKTTLLDRRLRFNVAAFWTKITNFQDTIFTGGPLGFITFNGPARSRGVEVESAFQVTPHFRLDLGATYANADGVIQPFDASGLPAVDASGNPVFARYRKSQAPKLIVNLGAAYEGPLSRSLDWSAGASMRHRSSMYNQRQEMFLSKQLTTVDLSLGIKSSDDRWGLDLVAKNVGNAISQDFASPSADPRFAAFFGAYLAGPNALRTIMLSGRVKF